MRLIYHETKSMLEMAKEKRCGFFSWLNFNRQKNEDDTSCALKFEQNNDIYEAKSRDNIVLSAQKQDSATALVTPFPVNTKVIITN